MCPYRTNNYNLCKYYNNDLQSKDCTWLSKDGKLKCINKHRNINIGNLPIINAQYSLLPGLNAIMIPLNQSNLTQASIVGTNIGTVEAVSEWIASTQSWNASVYYPELEMWDPDFDVTIGMPLMVNSLSSTIWPSGPRLIKSSNK